MSLAAKIADIYERLNRLEDRIRSGIGLVAASVAISSSGGDVVGPAVATDNAIARFDTTTGKLIQNSAVVVEDDGRLSNVTDPTGAQDAATKDYVDSAVVGAGGGNVTDTGAIGTEPGGAIAGDLFFPDNGLLVERFSGAAWKGWGPIFPLTDPTLQAFAWVNQGDADVDTTHGGIILKRPLSGGGGESLRIQKKAAPATPYTITALVIPLFGNTTNQGAGLCFRESGSGKVLGFCLHTRAINALNIFGWTDPVTYGGTNPLNASPAFLGSAVWLRIADDGVNRIYSYSNDGVNFCDLYTEARATFLTADEVGFFINPSNRGSECRLSLLSWEEA